jgi:DNA-binding CsgD family transcriptional regulator
LRGEADASAALVAAALHRSDSQLGATMDRVLAAFRAAEAALALADPSVLDTLRGWNVTRESLPVPFLSAFGMVDGVNELLAGRLDEARSIFANGRHDLFATGRGLALLAQIELARDDHLAAREVAARLTALIAGVAAPLHEATVALVLSDCDRILDASAALDGAHRALATAAPAELWPVVVDALEAIGSLLYQAGRERDAARLLAAAQVGRDTLPYRYRFVHRESYVAATVAVVADDDGWDEGMQLSLPEAVEVTQRMRGDRLRPATGWESLTRTERRVAEQVAGGLTNPEIAARLLMSRATVKTHLVHIFAKLDIANRSELDDDLPLHRHGRFHQTVGGIDRNEWPRRPPLRGTPHCGRTGRRRDLCDTGRWNCSRIRFRRRGRARRGVSPGADAGDRP